MISDFFRGVAVFETPQCPLLFGVDKNDILPISILCGEKLDFLGVTILADFGFWGLVCFRLMDFFGVKKVWPHSHLPVTDAHEYPPPPPPLGMYHARESSSTLRCGLG